jgi:hypothetical protein
VDRALERSVLRPRSVVARSACDLGRTGAIGFDTELSIAHFVVSDTDRE